MEICLRLIWTVCAIAWTVLYIKNEQKYEKISQLLLAGMVALCVAIHCL